MSAATIVAEQAITIDPATFADIHKLAMKATLDHAGRQTAEKLVDAMVAYQTLGSAKAVMAGEAGKDAATALARLSTLALRARAVLTHAEVEEAALRGAVDDGGAVVGLEVRKLMLAVIAGEP